MGDQKIGSKMTPDKFIIEGEVYEVLDVYLPDSSVGMFGEAGWYVYPENRGGDTEALDEHTKFVTMEGFRVFQAFYDAADKFLDFTGDTGEIAEVVK